MRLRTALEEYKRHGGNRFPEERSTTDGAFAGDGDRLVHVDADGRIRDCSYPLSGLGGIDRSRFGLAADGELQWLDDLATTRQHYAGDTPLVETEYDASTFSIHQFDLTVGRVHLTHFELRGAAPDEPELVAAFAFAPDAAEDRVGQLVHEGAGPEGGDTLELYHRNEHDFLTASTGLTEVRGEAPRRLGELLSSAPSPFPRDTEGSGEDPHLTAETVVRAPIERSGHAGRVTLVSLLADNSADGPDATGERREVRLDSLHETATAYRSARDLRETARAHAPDVPSDAPRADLVAADLRTLELLRSGSAGRIAAPEFDPYYSGSGGYGYTWFRDDAEIALGLTEVGDALGVDIWENVLASARFYCRTQDGDGGWPQRVWADSGELAPGWANDRIETAHGDADGPNDQLDQPASVVTFLATLLRKSDSQGTDGSATAETSRIALEPAERDRIKTTVEDGLSFLVDTLAENGLPRRCQNAWENALGQFAHTAGAYLRAFSAVAAAPVDDAVARTALEQADALFEALDQLWDEEADRYGRRLDRKEMDVTADASTFGLVDGVLAYDRLIRGRYGARQQPGPAGVDESRTGTRGDGDPRGGGNSTGDGDARGDGGATTRTTRGIGDDTLARLRDHTEVTIDRLFRDTGAVSGLIRTEGDTWRSVGQGAPKVWSVTSLWGVNTATALGERLETHGMQGRPLLETAGELYERCEPGGSFANDAGLLAEQAFDDGTLDSGTPLGWSHALRLTATVRLARNGALPLAHERPNGPEQLPRWTSGEKYGVATAAADRDAENPSRVWFTLSQGALTEARFPRIDVMNLRTVDFLVVDPETGYAARTYNESRRDDDAESIVRRTEPVADDALAYRQIVTETGDGYGHAWELIVEYVPDPDGDALLADVTFEASGDREYAVYAVVDVAVTNDGTDDHGVRVDTDDGFHLLATNAEAKREPDLLTDDDGSPFDVALAVTCEEQFDWATAASTGSSQLAELFAGKPMSEPTPEARGNVVLVGRLGAGSDLANTLAIGFAEDRDTAAALGEAKGALDHGFGAVSAAYAADWRRFLARYDLPESVANDDDLAAQYRFALMTLAAVEDKTHHGAGIASPSVPWGETETADRERGYGYNFVWSRDLYQVFTVLQAVGDYGRAVDALSYLYEYQQDEDGFLPQNTYINGRTRWGGEQMDNIAFPSVMAGQLYTNGFGFEDVPYDYSDVRRSVMYVARNGPRTAQERWEEEAGYSPSTIAAEIAGLACAADIALGEADRMAAEGEDTSAEAYLADALLWLGLADEWADRVTDWCATETGANGHERTPYFVRIARDGDPDAGHVVTIANDGPTFDEREVIDAGFLELVRLGIMPADDQVIRNSIAEVDDTIRNDTPHGPAWYRYVGDAYGELQRGDKGAPWHGGSDGKGRLWPIFSGERGEYEIRARGDAPDAVSGIEHEPELAPENLLRTFADFANEGRMIPEQVWDREFATDYNWAYGEGTGGATPLAWSMAGFVRLAHGIDAGEPVETPEFVRDRYVERDQRPGPRLSVTTSDDGGALLVSGETTADVITIHTSVDIVFLEPVDGEFSARVETGDGETELVVTGADDTDLRTAATCVQRVTL